MDSLTKETAVSRETLAPGTALQGINSLPDEILIEIFSYLGLYDLARCSRTCRRWRAILREEKSLWRGRECCTTSEAENIGEVLAVAGAMPRFETLSVSDSGRFGIKIAWPVATVFDNHANSMPTWEPYFRSFDTECLLIKYSWRNGFFLHLLLVDNLTLRRIVILRDTNLLPLDTPAKDAYFDLVRVFNNLCIPIQWVRDAHRGLFSRRGCRGGGTAEVTAADGAVCPALEEVKVSSYRVGSNQLGETCGLGPVRTLHVNCMLHRDLKFVRRCHATLEELELSNCCQLPEDTFADLLCLKRLRVLRLSECRIEAGTVGRYVADLPCLETCLVNGSEVLPEISS